MDTKKQEQQRAAARLEIGIWDALIGAQGSPTIQKFVIQQRLYAFARAAVNVSHEIPEREMRNTHSIVKVGMGVKIKNFIDFIEGNISVDEALKIKNALQELQGAEIIELAVSGD